MATSSWPAPVVWTVAAAPVLRLPVRRTVAGVQWTPCKRPTICTTDTAMDTRTATITRRTSTTIILITRTISATIHQAEALESQRPWHAAHRRLCLRKPHHCSCISRRNHMSTRADHLQPQMPPPLLLPVAMARAQDQVWKASPAPPPPFLVADTLRGWIPRMRKAAS